MGERAVELSPSHADNAAFLSMAYRDSGNPQKSLEYIKTAMRLSPTYPHWYLWSVAGCYREQLSRHQIHVNAVAPGGVITEMALESKDMAEVERRARTLVPLQRYAEPHPRKRTSSPDSSSVPMAGR